MDILLCTNKINGNVNDDLLNNILKEMSSFLPLAVVAIFVVELMLVKSSDVHKEEEQYSDVKF